MKFFKTPAARISLGIMALTVSLLLVADFIGIAPNRDEVAFEARKDLCESLALQFSAAATNDDLASIRMTLKSLVERDNAILSAALRSSAGTLLAVSGNHLSRWQSSGDGRSSLTHVQVPILKGQKLWGTVELQFAPLWEGGVLGGLKKSFLGLVLFVAITGFAGYFFMMRRTLRELDPSAVVPARVNAAFDVLKEGVLILDDKEQVVMSNGAFAAYLGKTSAELLGFKGSELGWVTAKSKEQLLLPWLEVMESGKSRTGVELTLAPTADTQIKFMVNAAPVMDGNGKSRGTLVTFDDVTELEEKNFQLNRAVIDLQISSKEITDKNEELEFLASHDPMTKLLNRRAFNERFAVLFAEAKEQNLELSCIMCDIDHFKAVNDTYGHGVGDEVIISVAQALSEKSRDIDLVGRYGGEEFCLVFSGLDIGQAAEIGDRIRQTIADTVVAGIQVQMSFGVSSLVFNAHEPAEMTNQADRALYVAKESGRNRVVKWGGDEESTVVELDDSATECTSNDSAFEESAEIDRLSARVRELEELAEKRGQELKHFTAYDSQTGLPTRALFHDRIMQAQARADRYDQVVAVLSVSLENVTRFREVFGHGVAEQLLKESGLRLIEILRSNDTVTMMKSKYTMPTVSLLGQDEFGVLLTDLRQVDHIIWIVKRIIDTLEKPFQVSTEDMYITPHVGISISNHDGDSAETLVKNASVASRRVGEQAGNDKYRFYSPDINDASCRQLLIEGQLHKANARDEFQLYYQPKVNAASGEIIGMEALIRWNSPQAGLVSPNDFIPIAENSGQINEIGEWVLAAACRQVRAWLDMGLCNCNVAINFSAKQFRHGNPVEKIRQLLDEYGLEPWYLEIEVTESAMMEDVGKTIAILKEIRALGLGVAIDDFGTGYSSLGYLKKLPGTHLKLDRSFVAEITQDENDASLVGAIVDMAHVMGLTVVGEGVERDSQAEMLCDFGCDELQGFLFSKPVPAKEATLLLQNGVPHVLERWEMGKVA